MYENQPITQIHQEFAEDNDLMEFFPKSEAKFMFKYEQGQIIDILVSNFKNSDDKSNFFDDGNCSELLGNSCPNWSQWSITDVFAKVLIFCNLPKKLHKKFLFELSKIEEWRPIILAYIWHLGER